jgi:hypothetical protein
MNKSNLENAITAMVAIAASIIIVSILGLLIELSFMR